MAAFDLVPHSDHPPLRVRGVRAELRSTRGGIALRYRVDGAGQLVVPAATAPERADALWRTTCFELFLKPADEAGYVEFNFSPSTCWAAYRFDAHRDGMRDLERAAAPKIDRFADGVDVACDLGGVASGPLLMGLTAVIEEEGGHTSYWALAHPDGPPDFHDPDCFVARLAAPERT
ncbi:DOMON-like domain-containing protein [Hephaestia sp. GCM10023244]|uniref:DOMON-like domain-containing protein n=1 Tax=unclassified Hephaestia TaxID=2631281 RepID=UPI0020779546|nr:DOMON-like domain-containing protein [Hephaestia sp. MAHUQ-44]MCM8729984.1 DOMON-like domain-containing protein [Hephaestia sp. MAHUQ-44]